MDKDKIINLLGVKRFKKFTGPPEHWLTTFNTKFWGLELKHLKKWEAIQVGELFIFHSTGIEYLNLKPKLPTGIIGVGIVGGTSRKETLEWIGEIKNSENRWPLLIHFSEIWWLGDYESIVFETIFNKIGNGENAIIQDLLMLSSNCVTFQEMRDKNCVIPAQGSIQNINDKSRRSLVSLIEGRLKEAIESPLEVTDESIPQQLPILDEDDLVDHIIKHTPSLKDLNLDETEEEAKDRQKKQIVYEQNSEAQENANKNHQKTLIVLANELILNGIQPKYSVIDLLAENNGSIFIFEVKTVHTNNFTSQTRRAIGQLLEYEYFQVASNIKNNGKKIMRGVVYNKKPPEKYIEFLENYNFFVYWPEDQSLNGSPNSKEALRHFLE
ncbi:hypothetical protein ACFLWK_01525 [Chloroflexota bacterium]